MSIGMKESFHEQIQKLRDGGFSDSVIHSVAEAMLRKMSGRCQKENEKLETSWLVVIPYEHKISHNLKKVGARPGVRVVFSAPNKLGRLCRVVNQEGSKQ